MAINILSFNEAFEKSKSKNKHLLLGNGFSIACRQNIFRYDKLFEQANFSNLSPSARNIFDRLQTTDFEKVIKVLLDTASIYPEYGITKDMAQSMSEDAAELKEILVQTIASSHPEIPSEINENEYANCVEFLNRFKTVYTLNYDLLLYWTKMKSEKKSDDGFRTSSDDIESFSESEYVEWDSSRHDVNLWFLHGALHIFDTPNAVRKYTWIRTGVRLIEQIRSALKDNYFPLFVSEGTSKEKLLRIRHNDYLSKAYRSFQSIQGSLFIYGHSLAENDEHILKVIERGKLSEVFISIFGDENSPENQKIIRRGLALANKRPIKRPLEVGFYSTESTKVWH